MLSDNQNEFKVDLSFLLNERPVGISGLMRVKDDAEFIALSIDSCIEALDELIIVYQKCNDNSIDIIKGKEEEFPDKIKSFFYEPEVFSHNLSEEQFGYGSNLPPDSPHLLSNYYNYTLSKASYKYALKIDADQIYNAEKLKLICDAYRTEMKECISMKEWTIGFVITFYSIVFSRLGKFNYKIRYFFPESWASIYFDYAIKRIRNDKLPASLCGINLYIKDDELYLPLGKYSDNTFPPFNGIDDHVVFQISNKTYYKPAPMKTDHASYKNCIIERFNLDDYFYPLKGWCSTIVNLGFLWYHVAPLKKRYYLNSKSKYKDAIVGFEKTQIKNLIKALGTRMFTRHRFWFCFWWSNWNHQASAILNNWKAISSLIMKKMEHENSRQDKIQD